MSSPPPREQLDPRALRLWRVSEALHATLVIAVAAVVSVALLVWTRLPTAVALLPTIAALVVSVISVVWVPAMRWRRWRYDIGAAEVDLQYGVWTITRTRVPMARIQHVDTRRGPLERRYGLATVVLYTAAGANVIPLLADDVADAVRDRIAALASTRDDV